MNRQTIIATRQSWALYLAWEFRPGKATGWIGKLEKVRPGFYRLPAIDRLATPTSSRALGKRAAERWAARMRLAIAYQQGRLRKALTGGDVYTESVS